MQDLKWWQRGVIYQIYPRSFQDSNGDGIGDLPGNIRRLVHVVTLGTDAIWISPIYPSPVADFGYDVTDYCNVAGSSGTSRISTDWSPVHLNSSRSILGLRIANARGVTLFATTETCSTFQGSYAGTIAAPAAAARRSSASVVAKGKRKRIANSRYAAS
jgi:alpha amylase-like protein